MKSKRAFLAAVPLVILLLPIGVYLADSALSEGRVQRNTTIEGIPVGGMESSDAISIIRAYENQLSMDTGVFVVNGVTFKLSPTSIGLTTDTEEAVMRTLTLGDGTGRLESFTSWIRSFSRSEDHSLTISFDDEAIRATIDSWVNEAIPVPSFNGDVSVVDGVVVPEYPRAGYSIDKGYAYELVVAQMSTLNKVDVVFEVIDSTPTLTMGDIDEAAQEMTLIIDSPITLASTDVGFRTTFTTEQLVSAVRADIINDGSEIFVTFDAERVLEILEPKREEYETEPVDAKFDINLETDEFTIVEGRSGTLLDIDSLLSEMRDAALGSGIGKFPLLVGLEPNFSTEAAEAFTSLEALEGFTTTHPANQPRVTNIHLMADTVNGAIVLPGEEWSINEHVGERTEEKGYLAAPAIINGEPYCCDHPTNIGGGVSQFGTTLYNAVFYSCLEDVYHRPHSLYFTRYPIGREATLGMPSPDVAFRNNTENPVVIATAYTDTSITVKMYGDNGDLTCTDDTHDPEEIVDYEEVFVADEEGVILPGEVVKIRSGINGFFIRVDRIVTYPDGRSEVDLELTHRYNSLSEQYLVHPCEVTGEPVDCPIQLALFVGMTWEEALEALSETGIFAARVDGYIGDPAMDGIVMTQNIAPSEWVEPGATVTLTIGVHSG